MKRKKRDKRSATERAVGQTYFCIETVSGVVTTIALEAPMVSNSLGKDSREGSRAIVYI